MSVLLPVDLLMNRAKFNRIYRSHLTPKQRQVLALILTGQNNQQIAEEIEVNDSSGISHHVRTIAEKFNIFDDYRDCLIELFIRYRPELVGEHLSRRYGSINSEDYYQVGGTLADGSPSYVARESDLLLLKALLKGNYCLVLNPRQTGKSSLKIRTIARLRERNIKCVAVDITCLGSSEIQESRTKGFVAELFSQLDIELDLNKWWQKRSYLTLMQRLEKAMLLLLDKIPDKIIVFIDEIDSIPNADDFFALIRACCNQRARNQEYKRLTFCLLGVTSPSRLMQDPQRTPFNIAVKIDLPGFSFDEAQNALLAGLATAVENPEAILKEIIYWTNGQPFLTQKLCRLAVKDSSSDRLTLKEIVQYYMIYNWQQQDSCHHLQTIGNYLLASPLKRQMLARYRQILTSDRHKTSIVLRSDDVDTQLILSGLIINNNGYLQIHNPIYHRIFDRQWLDALNS